MFYLLDKPKGISSFKAIRNFAREANIKKIGHTGTLDPLASGLLLVATDDDTKLIDYIDKGFKVYKATMKLGFTSDTYDVEGNIIKTDAKIPEDEVIVAALKSFEGVQSQMPPAFSAKKINGKRAYELARKGKHVELKPSIVEIRRIFDITIKNELITFSIDVSRGTYIRSIIHDLGQKIGVGAIMTELRRTSIGCLTDKNLGEIKDPSRLLILPSKNIDDIKDLFDGKKIPIKSNDGDFIAKHKDEVIGIIKVVNNQAKGINLFGKKYERIRNESR